MLDLGNHDYTAVLHLCTVANKYHSAMATILTVMLAAHASHYMMMMMMMEWATLTT